MEEQAYEIASWGKNVFVKVPVTNMRAEPATRLICRLALAGVRQNVTALMTLPQVARFPRRWARTGQLYLGFCRPTGRQWTRSGSDDGDAVEIMWPFPNQKLIWASPREVLNIFQADAIGCHIITVTNDLLKKLNLVGKDPPTIRWKRSKCSTTTPARPD